MDELIDELITSYAVEDLVLILEIDSAELIERFQDKVADNMYKFKGVE